MNLCHGERGVVCQLVQGVRRSTVVTPAKRPTSTCLAIFMNPLSTFPSPAPLLFSQKYLSADQTPLKGFFEFFPTSGWGMPASFRGLTNTSQKGGVLPNNSPERSRHGYESKLNPRNWTAVFSPCVHLPGFNPFWGYPIFDPHENASCVLGTDKHLSKKGLFRGNSPERSERVRMPHPDGSGSRSRYQNGLPS